MNKKSTGKRKKDFLTESGHRQAWPGQPNGQTVADVYRQFYQEMMARIVKVCGTCGANLSGFNGDDHPALQKKRYPKRLCITCYAELLGPHDGKGKS